MLVGRGVGTSILGSSFMGVAVFGVSTLGASVFGFFALALAGVFLRAFLVADFFRAGRLVVFAGLSPAPVDVSETGAASFSSSFFTGFGSSACLAGLGSEAFGSGSLGLAGFDSLGSVLDVSGSVALVTDGFVSVFADSIGVDVSDTVFAGTVSLDSAFVAPAEDRVDLPGSACVSLTLINRFESGSATITALESARSGRCFEPPVLYGERLLRPPLRLVPSFCSGLSLPSPEGIVVPA